MHFLYLLNILGMKHTVPKVSSKNMIVVQTFGTFPRFFEKIPFFIFVAVTDEDVTHTSPYLDKSLSISLMICDSAGSCVGDKVSCAPECL